MFKDKRGIIGLETVRTVIVILLILAVTAIAAFLAITSLQGANLFTDEVVTGTIVNETINLSFSGETPSTLDGRSNVVMSNVVAIDTLNGTTVPSAQMNIVAALINATDNSIGYANRSINVSSDWTSTFTSTAENETNAISSNVTGGTTEFFQNVPTFMVLLGVVVLLLIIAIVLVVVGRFGIPGSGQQGDEFQAGASL